MNESRAFDPQNLTRLKQRLNDDAWFKKLVETRYPLFLLDPPFEDNTFYHSNYPEMIAEILSSPCPFPFNFEAGSALAEIRNKVDTSK